jgi:PD-(D/E)XK nuclease superfamily
MAPNLPVAALSHSGIRTLHMCPRKWKFQYVENIYSPPSGPMLAGSAAGAAANASDHYFIEEGEFLDTEATLDVFSDEWEERLDREGEDADWGDAKPGDIKDATAGALTDYSERVLAELPKPIAVEREARLVYEGVEFVAYLDREQEDGSIADRKVKGKRMSQVDADADSQATGYMAVRRAEAEAGLEKEPTGFEFHTLIRQKTKRYAEVIPTERNADQLDEFLAGIYRAAEEIEFRMEFDNWSFAADGAWWCSEKFCGYWGRCPGGGLFRPHAAQAVAAA